jgi:uncharacterized protein (DUF305 family)
MRPSPLRHAPPSFLALVVLLVGCSGAVTAVTADTQAVQPAGQSEAAGTALAPRPGHTEADVRFMQAMLVHHAQALEMTGLVPERTEREDIRLLARRIEVSQVDEIAQMQSWLEARGEAVPNVSPTGGHHHHHHGHHGHDMPGMLTPEQLARLAQATGDEFDRLFLEFMIFHHEGAILMVEELFATEGAGQESEIFQFASHVDSDQRIEIARMRRMLHASHH